MADDKTTPEGRTAQQRGSTQPPVGAPQAGASAAPDRQGAGAAEQGSAGQSQTSGGEQGGERKVRSGKDRDRGLRTGTLTGGTSDAMAEEFERLGIDARLDNRLGDQRPKLSPHIKPQQFPGPRVGHFGEHADENREAFLEATGQNVDEGDVIGARSLGQIGRGEAEDLDTAAGSPAPNPQ